MEILLLLLLLIELLVVGGSRRCLAEEEAVNHKRRPRAHVAHNNEHNGQQVNDLVFVPEANSVRLPSLEFGEDSVEFYEDGAVEDAEAELPEPRLEQTSDASGLKVAHEDLIKCVMGSGEVSLELSLVLIN